MLAEQSWRQHYPFHSNYLTVDHHQYHFLDEGAGQTLLMVHGNPTWSFYWRDLIGAWRDKYRIVAPDHLGCGLSDKPRDYPYCLTRHTNNLEVLIEQLELRDITLLVHDWGGAIGLLAAVRRPEFFRRIVIFNSGAFPPRRVPARIAACRLPLVGTLAIRGLNVFTRAALRMATAQPHGIPKPARDGILAPYDCWANRIAIDRFVRDIPLTSRHPTYPILADLARGLESMRHCSIQIIWGMRDWCFDVACLERFIGVFPDARVHRIAHAGHWVVEDAHDEIIPVVEQFIAESPVAPEPSNNAVGTHSST